MVHWMAERSAARTVAGRDKPMADGGVDRC